MIVLDTNALIRWIGGSTKLSRKARSVIEKAQSEKDLFISSISVWEIYTLLRKGKLELGVLPHDWLARIEELSFVHFIPVDNKIAAYSVHLPDFSHKDPADRIIVATALTLGAKLITSDRRLLTYPHVQSVW